MARRRNNAGEEVEDLNLAPIMNMVMILIPLLLLSVEFNLPGVINISSNQPGQPTEPKEQEEEPDPVPRVVLAISDSGFRIQDQRSLPAFEEFSAPIARCGGPQEGDPSAATAPPTICNLSGVPDDAPLISRLDFAGLYNQLVTIRLQPAWYDRFSAEDENNDVISILADPDIPFDVLVKTMDVARYILEPAGAAGLPAPSGSVNIPQFLLGGDAEPTLEDFETAKYLVPEDAVLGRFSLFPNPVLLIPRSQDGS